MTQLFDPAEPTPPARAGGVSWQQARDASAAFACGHLHHPGGAGLDESARRLSHEEYRVARLLAFEGHQVRSLPESRRGGRCADLLVCGTPVEVKSFMPLAERRRAPTPQSVYNKLVDAHGQAAHVVLVGTGSGLSPATARRGLARYAGEHRPAAALVSVRVLGDGYDLAWARPATVQLASRRPASPERPRERSLGL